jgi:hypothetical protein
MRNEYLLHVRVLQLKLDMGADAYRDMQSKCAYEWRLEQ